MGPCGLDLARTRLARRADIGALDPAGLVALLDLIGLAAVLQAARDLKLACAIKAEAAGEIDGVDPFGAVQLAYIEVARAAGPKASVEAVVVPIRCIRAIGCGQVPVPAAQHTTRAADNLEVLVLEHRLGAEAIGRKLGQRDRVGGRTEGPVQVRGAAAIGAKAIEFDILIYLIAKVDAEDVGLLRHGAKILGHQTIDGLLARVRLAIDQRIEAYAVGDALGAVRGPAIHVAIGQASKPVLAQSHTKVGIHRQIAAIVAVKVAPMANRDLPALLLFIKDDIDHPGHGVRTILGRRTIAQNLKARNRCRGDHVQVHTDGTIIEGRDRVDQRGTVTALAIHQHQSLVGIQTPQRARGNYRRGATARAGRQVERGHQIAHRLKDTRLGPLLKLFGIKDIDRSRACNRTTGHTAHTRHNDIVNLSGLFPSGLLLSQSRARDQTQDAGRCQPHGPQSGLS